LSSVPSASSLSIWSNAARAFYPFNPLSQPSIAPDLAFNTAISFITNANWQAYAGETTMSHFTQMVGLTTNKFLDSAVAMAMAVALIRAFVRREADAIGNFWVDLTRATLYVLLPLSIVVALVLNRPRHAANPSGRG